MKAAILKILELFSENNGRLSNTRLNATTLIFSGIFIIVYSAINKTLDGLIIGAGMGLITTGMGGKLISKTQEEPTPPAEVKQ